MNRIKCECGHEFTPKEIKLTIHEKIGPILTRRRSCKDCWNRHYNQGEK